MYEYNFPEQLTQKRLTILLLSIVMPVDTAVLKNIYKNFTLDDAAKVKEFEKETNHDVKSIEYYLKEKIDENKYLEEKGVSIFVHFINHIHVTEHI